jgi:hypothetical protein
MSSQPHFKRAALASLKPLWPYFTASNQPELQQPDLDWQYL